jgi:hypothetical protein
MTLAHWNLRLSAKSPHPPFKGGARSAGGFVAVTQVYESCGVRFSARETWRLRLWGVCVAFLDSPTNTPSTTTTEVANDPQAALVSSKAYSSVKK